MLEYESAVYASDADSWGQSSGGRARVGSQSCEMWMFSQKRLELGCGASQERSFDIASAGLAQMYCKIMDTNAEQSCVVM